MGERKVASNKRPTTRDGTEELPRAWQGLGDVKIDIRG